MIRRLGVACFVALLALGVRPAAADLLGVSPGLPVIEGGTGTTDYVPPAGATPGTLTIELTPATTRWALAGPFSTSSFVLGSNLTLTVRLNALGQLSGAAPGSFILSGEVTERDPLTGVTIQTYSGDLLTGSVLDFGSAFDGASDLVTDFRFLIGGGTMATRLGQNAFGVVVTTDAPSFNGFNDVFSGSVAGFEAGPVCGGRIGDRVWSDVSHDGVQDAGEPGLAGVIVTATNLVTSAAAVATTDAAGAYLITGLCAGTYRLTTSNVPSGFVPTLICSTNPLNPNFDPDCTPQSDSSTSPVDIVLATNATQNLDVDFGYFQQMGAISGRVWSDVDGDKTQDAGEPGLAGVKVTLTKPDTSTVIKFTAGDGTYAYDSLPLGAYQVCVQPPAGYGQTFDRDFPATPHCAPAVLGTSQGDVDFGYQQFGSLGDRVWNDVNGNGTIDGGEAGLSAWTVKLNRADGTPLGSMGTNASGAYGFSQLFAGTYNVCVTPLAGYVQTYDLDSTATANCATVSLSAGQTRTDVDFGYQLGAKISNLVWDDVNGNGRKSSTELGLPGVKVQLAGPMKRSKTTNANGVYSFTKLRSGTYTVCAAPPSGYRPTYDRDGLASPNCTQVTVNAGQTRNDIDFGYRLLTGIGGRVWDDEDGDAVQDPLEPGRPVDLVTLKLDNGDGSTTTLATTTPDGGGIYDFGPQPPGTYVVCVSPPPGFVPTYDLDGIATAHCATFATADGIQRDVHFGYWDRTTPDGSGR